MIIYINMYIIIKMKLPLNLIRYLVFEFCDKKTIKKCIQMSPKIGFPNNEMLMMNLKYGCEKIVMDGKVGQKWIKQQDLIFPVNSLDHGNGYIKLTEFEFYKGPIKNNKPHGYGQIVHINGDLTIGEYKKGKKENSFIVSQSEYMLEVNYTNDVMINQQYLLTSESLSYFYASILSAILSFNIYTSFIGIFVSLYITSKIFETRSYIKYHKLILKGIENFSLPIFSLLILYIYVTNIYSLFAIV